ncbi:MAG: transglycosylase SLT domain-containing protein [Anaerolineae bacterium]|nr:transglycosylase SLT domain-containing protein [Anaerolineae bacterium]
MPDRKRGESPGRQEHAESPRPGGLRSCLVRFLPALVLLCALLAMLGPRMKYLVEHYLAIISQYNVGEQPAGDGLAPLFTAEVDHWAADIRRWAAEYGLDPQLVATVVQIESCGDPRALSPAGAAGLLQVMPQHFAPGEDPFDPETNARRGLGVLVECLTSRHNPERDVGLAFACYNGGPSVFVTAWDYWPQQSRDYYIWGTGIYADAQAGATSSEVLDRWLLAGGQRLCQSARQTLGFPLAP